MSFIIKCPHCNEEFRSEPLEEILNPTVRIVRVSEERSSWHDIADMIHDGRAYMMFNVGDKISCTLKNGKDVDIDVAGINVYGDNRVVFCFHDCFDDASMNERNTNRGGFSESKMKRRLDSEIFNLLPDDLQDVISSREIIQEIGGTAYKSECKLWLPSIFEVYGEEYSEYSCEKNDAHLPIFANPRSRVKFRIGDSEKYSIYWWLRSPYVGSTTYFWIVSSLGYCGGNYGGASYSSGVCPCFII